MPKFSYLPDMAFQDCDDRTLNVALASRGYRVALAVCAFNDSQFARAIELCRQQLLHEPRLLGARGVYAKALLATSQFDAAIEQCHLGLAIDPDNEVLLKVLGDSLIEQGNIAGGVSCYQRILDVNPHCRGLHCELKCRPDSNERTLRFVKGEEIAEPTKKQPVNVLFYTETIGDLYLNQGHPRLAAEVFRTLMARSETPRLRQKLTIAEERIRNKEEFNVSSTD